MKSHFSIVGLLLGEIGSYLGSPFLYLHLVGYCLCFLLVVSVLHVISFVHFELVCFFVQSDEYSIISFNCMLTPSFSSIIYWICFFFSLTIFGGGASYSNIKWLKQCVLLVQSSVLFHWSTFHFYFCISTMLFLLLWLDTIYLLKNWNFCLSPMSYSVGSFSLGMY